MMGLDFWRGCVSGFTPAVTTLTKSLWSENRKSQRNKLLFSSNFWGLPRIILEKHKFIPSEFVLFLHKGSLCKRLNHQILNLRNIQSFCVIFPHQHKLTLTGPYDVFTQKLCWRPVLQRNYSEDNKTLKFLMWREINAVCIGLYLRI